MKLIESIEDNTLLITPINIKSDIIKKICTQDKIINVKYTSFEEIEKQIYNYDKTAIYYLMEKYNYKYDVAITYLDAIRYIEDKNYSQEKLNNLNNLKKELIDQQLITLGNLENIAQNKIIIYGYSYINNYKKKIIDSLKKEHQVEIIKEQQPSYTHKIYEFSNDKEELTFVANQICKLLEENINIENIKLIVEDSKYYNQLKFIFSLFNLNTSITNEISLNITPIGKYFLENIEKPYEEILTKIQTNFDLNKNNNLKAYNELIKIINTYQDKTILKNMIKYDIKKTKLKEDSYKEKIEIIPLLNSLIKEEDYVFLIGFNQKTIPHIYKDEQFLTDNELKILNIETSYQKNQIEEQETIQKITEIKNLIITYKLHDNTDNYLISNINDKLNYEIIKNYPNEYNFSNIYNKLKLAIALDQLVKYNVYSPTIDKLYKSYSSIEYLTYNNEYTNIEVNNLMKYLNNKLILSYTALNNYYECSFKYYLANILKIVPYTKTYMTIIGELFHYILSKAFINDFNFEEEYKDFINKIDYEFSNKEKFFLTKLKNNLKFIIETIKKQYTHTTFNKALYEEKVILEKQIDNLRVTFMGIIDKVMYKEEDNKILLAIIDYKTGNTDINLNNSVYGIDMQLPIYLYLANNIDNSKEKVIIGFYLQKLLHPPINKDYKKTSEEISQSNLKLTGYSIDNQKLLEEFDDSYTKSKVISGMSTNKDGSFSRYAKILSKDNIKDLEKQVEENITKAIQNIKNANFQINPKVIDKENKSCKYCEFYDICYKQNKDIIKLENQKLFNNQKEEE